MLFRSHRTIEEFEKYVGLDFKRRRVHRHTYDLHIGPPPFITQELWDQQWLSKFRYCIDLDVNNFKENDYEAWIIAFKDDKGKEIVRVDANKEEVNTLIQTARESGGWIRLWREFDTEVLPYTYVVWPYSASKGWCERVENGIPCPPKKIAAKGDPKSLWPEYGRNLKKKFKFNEDPNERKIFLHLPAYRDPELIPTIEDAIKNAKNPKRLDRKSTRLNSSH